MRRREFLELAGAGALGILAAGGSPARALATPSFPADPFALGVASGDPAPDGVVLWTRLAGEMPARKIPVRWEVARDEAFRRVVRRGRAWAVPELAHSVHAEVEGLQPGREYFYRFKAGPEISPVGRTITAPSRWEGGPFRFAFVSCQDWQNGFYTAYRHLADEDVSVVLHLGDYIYEDAPDDDAVRPHDGAGEPVTLEQYRARHALYKTDPDLQLAHARFPFVVTFDDHEVDNDWAADIPQDPDLQPRDAWLARRAAAFRAYYEHMPVRRPAWPRGSAIQIYRRLRFGPLVEFNVLDTRQFRSRTEPCGYGTGPVCPEVLDPARTMLGDEQERWLVRGLDRSDARWNVLAQQVPIARLDVASGPDVELKLDKWDAYPVARQRLLDFLRTRRPANPVAITGDLHDNWVCDLKADFEDPASEIVGTEFIGTSISSDGDGAERSEEGEIALAENPHVRFHNYRRGYVRCEVTREQWRTDFRVLPYVTQPGAPIGTRASFVVRDGRPGAVAA